jgi:hypothetical protein
VRGIMTGRFFLLISGVITGLIETLLMKWLTPQLHLMLKLRISGAILLIPQYALMTCPGATLLFKFSFTLTSS